MPFTKEQMKEYRQANKEKIKEQQKEYREANKEKIKEYQKKYYEANKQKKKEYKKEYNQTENGKKSNRISDWKSNGVISDDFNALYNKYINTNECELCGTCLTNKKHLDHCQNIICGVCNTIVMRKK